MSKISISPNTERKKSGNSVARWVKYLLRNRRFFLLAIQALFWAVKLMQALKKIFGDP